MQLSTYVDDLKKNNIEINQKNIRIQFLVN